MKRESKRATAGGILRNSRQGPAGGIPLVPFVPPNPGESRIKFTFGPRWDAEPDRDRDGKSGPDSFRVRRNAPAQTGRMKVPVPGAPVTLAPA